MQINAVRQEKKVQIMEAKMEQMTTGSLYIMVINYSWVNLTR